MSFSSEYQKLRKKRLEEAEKKADSQAQNKTFTDTYNDLRNERLAEERVRDVNTDSKIMLTNFADRNLPLYDKDSWRNALSKMQEESDTFHANMKAKYGTLEERKKKEEENTWFTAGAFDDGYDFGDITKTILGTGTELVDNVVAGVAEMGENVVDFGATVVGGVGGLFSDEFQKDVEGFIADDLIDGDAVGNVVGYVNPLKWGNELINGGDAEANSILGEEMEGVAQSFGQWAVQAGLQAVGVPWWLTSGVTGFGGGVEKALNEGATFGTAGVYGSIVAGAEIIGEKLGGISFGGKTLADTFVGPLTKNISSKLVKGLVNVGVDATAEGLEEIFSAFAGRLGSALYKDESVAELLTSEEAVDEYINSFIGGAILGGGIEGVNAIRFGKKGRDHKTGLTDNEQKVLDKVVESEIAKAEEGGKTLTSKEKVKIEEQVKRDLQKGFISTDTIEEVLGGDTYKAYKDAVANEDAIKKEYADLGSKEYLDPAEYERYTELGKLIEETDSKQLKAEADKSFAELLKKDDYLKNSYAERGRRSQKFDADLSQYTDENAKKTVENAIKYGMHNGTDAHEFVDFAAKLASKKGYVVDFTNTRMLRETGKAQYGIEPDAANVEGFVSESKKTIVVNMDAKRSLKSIVGHEITHTLEDAKVYDQLQKYITEYAKQKGEYDTRLSDIEGRYKGVKADVQKELTADLSGDYLLTDYDFIQQLATKDRNVFQKVYDEIKYLFKLATTGSKEARALEKAKHYYEKALREATKADKTAEGNKYSLSDSDGKKLTKEQSEYFKDSKMRDENGQVNLFANEAEDPAEKEVLRINNRLDQERARLRTELQQKKAGAQAIADNKDAFISKKASELYEELRNLKKGVRASKDLGYLLDHGYEWSAVKAALVNIKHTPGKRVNQNSAIESIAREMINGYYEDAVYRLDELDAEYQDKVAKLEAGAESQRQQARAGEATAETVESESKPRTRKDLHQEKIDNLDKALAKKGYSLLDVLKSGKNLSTFRTVDNTPQRLFEKTFGYEVGQILADETVNKVAENETEGIKWLNSITDRKNGLLAKLSKQYHIKPGSKESAAAQMFAEGFYVNDKGDYITYGIKELAQDFPDANVRANIIGLAGDQRIRQFYDDTLAAINESRARNLYPEIPRRDNYFLHFREMEDTYSRMGLPFNPNDIRAKDLPTDFNGVSADLKPGKPFFASEMRRSGEKTTHDLLGGLERYATSAKNQIYHIDDIQNFRAFRNFVADTYGQAKGLEGLDELTEAEQRERIEEVFDAHLSNFAKFLHEEANILAGKTALIDRGIEGIIGRRGMMFVDTVNKQVGSNMVGYNVSSSLTNLLAGVQAIAKTNKASAVKAFAQTTASKFGSIFGNENTFAENDPFLIRRKGAERFHRTPFQKIGDAGYFLASAVDNVTSEFVVRAKYNEFIKKGMGQQQAIEEADKWAARLMGDRSLGQMPHLYNSKMLGLVTKFQLEVRNQLDSQFYDTVQEAKMDNKDTQSGLVRNSKIAAKVTKTLFELAVLQHVFGKAFEAVAGYNPAFDILSVLATAFGFDDEEDSEDTVLDNVEQGFLELLEDLPYTSTFTGGRIPISSALPIEELVTGQDEYGNDKSRLETLAEIAPYYVLPGGYGQLKKTVQGLSMFDDDLPVPGSYTDSGNLRFPVEDTFGSRLQAGIFGQWASENARDYFDNERKPLNEKQTQEYIDSEMSIDEYWEYREGLSGLSTLAEKADYIYDLDIPTWKKNLLINNIADRKEDIDMSDYGNYDSFAEFDFAMKNPEKYDFLTENGISYQEYVGADEDTKEAYNWAYKNPEEYRMWKAVGDDVTAFRQYAKDIYDLEADKDEEGKSIRGSRKEKVIDYVSNLDVDYGVKCILFKSEYPADDTYNADILDYLNSREDLTYDDIKTILTELGYTVYDDGTVEW